MIKLWNSFNPTQKKIVLAFFIMCVIFPLIGIMLGLFVLLLYYTWPWWFMVVGLLIIFGLLFSVALDWADDWLGQDWNKDTWGW